LSKTEHSAQVLCGPAYLHEITRLKFGESLFIRAVKMKFSPQL